MHEEQDQLNNIIITMAEEKGTSFFSMTYYVYFVRMNGKMYANI